MTDLISVDPEILKSCGSQFRSAAYVLSAGLAELKRVLGALGEPWGDDEQGDKFAAAFVPHRDQLYASLDILTRGLYSVDDGLHTMAQNLTGADGASVINAE